MNRVSRLGGGLPSAIKHLLLINGVCYVATLVAIHWIAPRDAIYVIGGELVRLPRGAGFVLAHLALSTDGILDGQIWQLVTYMFLHDFQNPWHILFNLLVHGLNLLVLRVMFVPIEVWGAAKRIAAVTMYSAVVAPIFFAVFRGIPRVLSFPRESRTTVRD